MNCTLLCKERLKGLFAAFTIAGPRNRLQLRNAGFFNLSFDGGGGLIVPQFLLLKISPLDQTLSPISKFTPSPSKLGVLNTPSKLRFTNLYRGLWNNFGRKDDRRPFVRVVQVPAYLIPVHDLGTSLIGTSANMSHVCLYLRFLENHNKYSANMFNFNHWKL